MLWTNPAVAILRNVARNGKGARPHRAALAARPRRYILEGNYEVKINDGPVQTLKSGDVFYEAPNALHAISGGALWTTPRYDLGIFGRPSGQRS
jgi:hypothetical protein